MYLDNKDLALIINCVVLIFFGYIEQNAFSSLLGVYLFVIHSTEISIPFLERNYAV